MRAELGWRILGDRVAEQLVSGGVGRAYADPWQADWRTIVGALVEGERPVNDCVVDFVRMLTLARDLYSARAEDR